MVSFPKRCKLDSRSSAIPIALALTLAGCSLDRTLVRPQAAARQPAAVKSVEGPRSPRELLDRLMQADNRGDLEAVIALYADAAVLLPPNEPSVVGKPAIRARYTKMFASTRMQVRFEIDDDKSDGSVGYIRGRTMGRRVSIDGRRTEDLNGKFVMILARSDRGWSIASLIWNADR